jgi:hypothetical protein
MQSEVNIHPQSKSGCRPPRGADDFMGTQKQTESRHFASAVFKRPHMAAQGSSVDQEVLTSGKAINAVGA